MTKVAVAQRIYMFCREMSQYVRVEFMIIPSLSSASRGYIRLLSYPVSQCRLIPAVDALMSSATHVLPAVINSHNASTVVCASSIPHLNELLTDRARLLHRCFRDQCCDQFGRRQIYGIVWLL